METFLPVPANEHGIWQQRPVILLPAHSWEDTAKDLGQVFGKRHIGTYVLQVT